MGKLVLLDKTHHKQLRVDPQAVQAQGALLRLVPVVLSEFLKLSVQYPIVITKNKETGHFICVSLFGFESGENLFWKDNAWDAIYTPLNVVRQPFFIGKDDTDTRSQDNFVLCIDVDSDSIQPHHGERLFDDQGDETPYLSKMKTVMSTLLDGESRTEAFVSKLLTLDLLTPVSLEITFINNDSQRVEGMYTIDEDKLRTLTDTELIDLHKLDYLAPVYTMINSLAQIYALVHRKNAVLSKGQQWFKPVGV